MNGKAAIVTFNMRDFRNTQRSLNLTVMTPLQLVSALADEN